MPKGFKSFNSDNRNKVTSARRARGFKRLRIQKRVVEEHWNVCDKSSVINTYIMNNCKIVSLKTYCKSCHLKKMNKNKTT